MIVSCPECHTLYRHRSGARRRARCGACHAEVVLPAARTYVVQSVEVPAFAGVASAPREPDTVSRTGPWPGSMEGVARPRRGNDRENSGLVPAEPSIAFDTETQVVSSAGPESDAIDRRLDRIARAARASESADGAAVRAILFGVGLGTIGGVAFAPGMFHASWLGWAAGGVFGGALGALWSRVWGSRRV